MTEREEIMISLKALKRETLKMQQFFSEAEFDEFCAYSDITVDFAKLITIMEGNDANKKIKQELGL